MRKFDLSVGSHGRQARREPHESLDSAVKRRCERDGVLRQVAQQLQTKSHLMNGQQNRLREVRIVREVFEQAVVELLGVVLEDLQLIEHALIIVLLLAALHEPSCQIDQLLDVCM